MSERNDDELIERIAHVLRAEERVDPSFDARVMASIRSAGTPARRRAVLRWWLRPRTLTLSPLGGLAFAAGLAAVVATGTLAVRGPASSPAARVDTAARESAVRTIQFVLTAPTASRVALAGDFNGWSTTATPLRRASGTGVWTVSVPLTPGRHAYAFVVDDSTWVTDPAAPLAPENDFGPPNSVVTVLGAST